jgi:uncharacterized protein HemY
MTDRIRAIEGMLEKTPDDVFLQYSLGMEYASGRRYKDAVQAFKRCIDLDEEYLPAYVEAGKSLRSGGELDAAREMFARGMELATRKGESHVRDFIRQQLEALPRKE